MTATTVENTAGTQSEAASGRVVSVRGPVVDVEFPKSSIPDLFNALHVKVDAEGHDRQILESILPILREARPVIRAEVYRGLKNGERCALFDQFPYTHHMESGVLLVRR